MLEKVLPLMQLQDLVFIFGLFTVILATIIEKLPIKFNPWTYLFRMMGRTANHDVIERQNELEKLFKESCREMNKKIDAIEQGLTDSCDEIHEYRAIEARRRILQFADEVSRNIQHSEEHFDDVLKDITDYEDYCDKHEEFENEKSVLSIEIIRESYKENLRNNSFLRRERLVV